MAIAKSGKYIVLEGPQAVGKTSQLRLLADKLLANGHIVRTFREADGDSDPTVTTIREITQNPRFPMNARTEILLHNAARSQSAELIRRQLLNGVTCLSDRNHLSTIASQYYGRDAEGNYDLINVVNHFAANGLEPDLMIVLDAPVDVLVKRQRSGENERFGDLPAETLAKVRRGYLWEAQQRGYPVVDATAPAEEVFEQIWILVAPLFKEQPDEEEPTPIAEVIKKKQRQIKKPRTASKPKRQDSKPKDQKPKSKSRSRRNRSKKS